VTYNFDPDRWFDNELAALEARWKSGAIGATEFETAHEALIQRYEDMVQRLNGTFRLPADR